MIRVLVMAVLLALVGSGSVTAATDPFPGVYLTRLTNVVLPDNVPLTFDTASADPLYGSWDGGARIVIARTGWYWVGGDFTTLGSGYGGPPNDDWVAQIERNGTDLAHAIVAERHAHSSGGTADIMSIGSPVYLYAGDYVQVIFQNMHGGGLLIESNPSVPPASGSDYRTQPGSGVISPHLFVIFQ